VALEPGQIAQAADTYLQKLATDPDARSGLVAASGAEAVAAHVAKTTGLPVTTGDLDGIAEHINTNRPADAEQLAAQFPALGEIIEGSL